MRIQLPPPLVQAPPPRSFWQDFRLLLATQARVTWNKIRHWPARVWLVLIAVGLGSLGLLSTIGYMLYLALAGAGPETAQGVLSLFFMVGLAGEMFFGLTAAFAALYMSEDLELLFATPVSTRAVFAAKTISVAVSNLFAVGVFIVLPGIFYGRLCAAAPAYYLWLAAVALALLAVGTGLAELLNMAVMRIVPPHRSREAVGAIGAVSGILIALFFQLPGIILSRSGGFNLGDWLAARHQLLQVMSYFPWGWSAQALIRAGSGRHLSALGWTLPVLALGAGIFFLAFLLVERGFRRGWISLSQGGGGRRRSGKTRPAPQLPGEFPVCVPGLPAPPASPWHGMWAVARKDLLYLKRDTREWFGYITPLLLMLFFVVRFLFFPGPGARESLLTVLVMYTIMFSGNMALQSFGREGEADWLLNSVPQAGWPVVWGKLIAAVLPTLVLMEALITGTGLALGLAPGILTAMALGAALISLGSSAIGLYYSVHNCRYNPDVPQQRIAPGATLVMYLINLLFIALLAVCLLYIFPPGELLAQVGQLPPVPFAWDFPEILFWFLSLLLVPMRWAPAVRTAFGLLLAGSFWLAVFLGFMKATVRQSLKGFRVELVTAAGRKRNRF